VEAELERAGGRRRQRVERVRDRRRRELRRPERRRRRRQRGAADAASLQRRVHVERGVGGAHEAVAVELAIAGEYGEELEDAAAAVQRTDERLLQRERAVVGASGANQVACAAVSFS